MKKIIKRQKYLNKRTKNYRSLLEEYCANRLKEEGIVYVYEGLRVPLVPSFTYNGISHARIGKKFRLQSNSIRAVTYLADFSDSSDLDRVTWIIETKGFPTATARLKWKLLKKYLNDTKKSILLMMPTNKGEVNKCIEYVKELNKVNTGNVYGITDEQSDSSIQNN